MDGSSVRRDGVFAGRRIVAQPPNRGKAPPDRAAAGDAEGDEPEQGRPPGPPPDGFGPPGGDWQPGHPPGGPRENLASLKKSDPELYKVMKKESDLDRRINAVAKKYRGASKAQQDKIKKEVQKLAAEQFEVSQQRRSLELKHRDKTKQQIIDQRVSQALNQTDGGREGGGRRGPRGPMGPGGEDGPPMGPPGGDRPPPN